MWTVLLQTTSSKESAEGNVTRKDARWPVAMGAPTRAVTTASCGACDSSTKCRCTVRWSSAKLDHTFTQRLHIHTQTPDRARLCTQYPNFLYLVCHEFSDRKRQPLTQKGWQFYKAEDTQRNSERRRAGMLEENIKELSTGRKQRWARWADRWKKAGTVQSIPKD